MGLCKIPAYVLAVPSAPRVLDTSMELPKFTKEENDTYDAPSSAGVCV